MKKLKKISNLSNQLVQNWGDRQLSVLELDDRIATAAEKAPTEDPLIKLLRESLSDVKKEYDKVLIHEEKKMRKLEVYMLSVLKDMNEKS